MSTRTELGKECGSPLTSTPMESESLWFQYERQSVQKQGKKARIRVCIDYSVTVNSDLETHRQPIPLPEDLIRNLPGGYCFTKVDLADACNQIELSPKSQKSLVLSTHQRVLLQMRLPFGIKSAPGYFQELWSSSSETCVEELSIWRTYWWAATTHKSI